MTQENSNRKLMLTAGCLDYSAPVVHSTFDVGRSMFDVQRINAAICLFTEIHLAKLNGFPIKQVDFMAL